MKTYDLCALIRFELSPEDITDIMVTALEGGIGYWACLDNTSDAYQNAPENEPVAVTAAKELLDGNYVRFEDAEDGSEYLLTLQEFLQGFLMWIEDRANLLEVLNDDKTVDTGMIDGACADEIIQYALFGELVFG